ncbi:glycosyltransferase family 4 protein [Antarcticibacterium flavum]|uniref:Glycosyltransferase family 4 protein n=1 Tax=Antarcticibacterium flavum TaxID=2058175 RepID=A0A5B7X648_9FLAO|nr:MULTISPECIES: glycosyltransferase family 4 protein [Antarcticibacterium]MCM4159361.1 glycosyltransferase family 1 protein [Antarcticibacterium sp. W02-3]QCY70936.1 glycosyltransferase family 4 protein [Antarcticibacterium flavum]
MNILHLSAVKNWGGGGNHIENLCYELYRSNPEVKNIIVVAKGGQFHERLKNGNFEYDTVPLSMNLDPRALLKFIRLCRKHQIDLVHLHGSTSLSLAVIATKLSSLPPFIFSKKTTFPIKERKQTLYKYNHRQIKKILCVSDGAKKVAEKAIDDKSKLKTIYHGTRIDNKSTETPFLLRKKFNIPDGSRIVGHIGNHIRAKDLETWISAIDHLVNKLNYQNIFFVQIGTFSKQTSLLFEMLKANNLEERVFFTGYVPNASNLLPQMDTLSISSQSEGLPQVIYEAAWHKVPVASTDVGGIPEFISHNENGLLSPKKDAVKLAENLAVLLANPDLGKTFASRSHEKLQPQFTAAFMARQTLEVYREVLNK